MLIISISAFLIDEPVEISLKSNTCLGGSYCLVGEEITLNLKFNQDAKLKQNEITTRLISDTLGIYKDISINSTNSDVEIPLKMPVSISNGKHKLSIDTSSVVYDTFFKNKLLSIKHLFSQKANEEINLRYPEITIDENNYKCLNEGYSFDKIDIRLSKNEEINKLSCKIRIYVDEKTITNDSELKKGEDNNETYDYYETKFFTLDKNTYPGVQDIDFKTAQFTQITNAYLIPVCEIEGSEVEIKTQIKELYRCKI